MEAWLNLDVSFEAFLQLLCDTSCYTEVCRDIA